MRIRQSRREFIKSSTLGLTGAALSTRLRPINFPYIKSSKIANKVIVLGMDGMDPNFLRRFMDEGAMPTFKKFIEGGAHFGELQTTMPPQSPVAWSSFITGTNPGGNGIFDFIHRDPRTFTPYLSTSRSSDSKEKVSVGKWNIPLKSGKVELMRKGPAFWKYLEERGIPTTIFQIPANFPVVDSASNSMSGMGTPDLLGTYGTFTLYTEKDLPGDSNFEGGRVVKVRAINHVFRSKLVGPKNSFRSDPTDAEVEVVVNRDPFERMVRVTIQDNEIILRQGEWSEWIPIKFELMPMFASVSGMVRLYIKDVHPYFKMYVSPINVDPMDPSLPICSPASYSKELSQAVGRFYTQGFPADTKALSHGALTDDEYFSQAKLVIAENTKAFDYELGRFNEGVFFFYFSSVDQNCHMMLRNMDPSHPLYDPNGSPEVKGAVRWFYSRMDDMLRKALEKADNYTTVVALSDHGFAPFRREFNLSTWLVNNGYTVLTDPSKMGEGEFYKYVDWSKTRAYALGLNGIYVNLEGREKFGHVKPDEVTKIKEEIALKLGPVRDPKTGGPIVTRVYDSQTLYSGPFVSLAPDLVVGYQSGYRISDESVLGKFPKEEVSDRTNKWSSDHCLDPAVVPGILVTNKRCLADKPGLWDMAPSILNAFGISTPKEMDGKAVLET